MVVYISLALPLVLVMMSMPNMHYCILNKNNLDLNDKISSPLIYSLGKMSSVKEKRSLSGTQDWGKRSGPARPLRLGKRSFKITNMNPAFRGLLNSLRPYSYFGF